MRPLYSLNHEIEDEQRGGRATKWLITEQNIVDGTVWDVIALDDEVCESWAEQAKISGGTVYIYPIEDGRLVYEFLKQKDPKLLPKFDDSFKENI